MDAPAQRDPAADLARDTAVTPVEGAPGRYAITLPPHWNYYFPSGGVQMTAALRAMLAELANPAQRPISATATFCAPLPDGPLVADVEVLRRGSAASQLRAHLRRDVGDGERGPGLELVATFARPREGFDVRDVEPPCVPGPDALPIFQPTSRRFTAAFPGNFEIKRALGDDWWTPGARPSEAARSGYWYRYRAPQRREDGTLDPLALPPIADTMPGALFQKVGPPARGVIAPSLDLTLHFLEDTRREWVLVYAHARRARAGYATADVELWDDEGRLLAYGTQMMILRRTRLRRA
ncbi:MAG: thioesterase family protein [Myxococcales bacterium]|nr:thioesterase family protein [Myxococcales bacterium]